MKSKFINNSYRIQPFLAFLALLVTQDILINYFFRKKIIVGLHNIFSEDCAVILAPTHRSRWDGLVLTYAAGRRVTSEDCRFMVTRPEMKGIQGWFLRRLGCFSINQNAPSLSSLRYALKLINAKKQLVVFPEGKINKLNKKLPLKQGLFRLARLAKSKGTNVMIVPIGIAYSQINPKFGSNVALCFEKPLYISDFLDSSINRFNSILSERMNNAQNEALKIVDR